MKKSNIVIGILVVIFIICCVGVGILVSFGGANSKNKNLILTCNQESIKMGEEVTCTLKGKVTEYEVSAVSSILEESTDFELIEVVPDSSWEGDGENGDIEFYTDVNKSGTFPILTFRISLIQEEVEQIEIRFTNNGFFDEEFQEHKIEDVTKILSVQK